MTASSIKNFFKLLAAFVICFIAANFFGAIISNAIDESRINSYVCRDITIESGDTLWKLAKEYGPQGEDTRKVVSLICSINDIHMDSIKTGDIIKVPAYIN